MCWRIGLMRGRPRPEWMPWCWILPLLLLVTGCGASRHGAGASDSRVIVDMDGRSVQLPAAERIQRAAILTSPAVQIAYVLGCQGTLCAVTMSVKRWPLLADLDSRIKSVPACRAGAGQVNLEALLAASPDVCIGSGLDLQTVETRTSIPALHVAAGGEGSFTQQIRNEVAFLGRIFGKESRAQECLAWLYRSRNTLKEATSAIPAGKRPSVFMGFGADHLTTFGASTFMQEWIEAAGCRNAAEEIHTSDGKEGGLAQVSMEQVLRWTPEILVLDEGSARELERNPQWRDVPAVRQGRVFRLPTGIFIWNRASFESAALLPTWLAVKAQPERFRDFSFDEEARRFYLDMFGFRLSEAQLRSILHPEG